MRNRKGIVALVSTALVLAPSAFAGAVNSVRDTRSNQAGAEAPRRHATLGLVAGAVTGLVVGGLVFKHRWDEDSWDGLDGSLVCLWGASVVGGAAAGYAIGGGFADRADQALELGRERIRDAEIAAALEDAPLPELRLSSVAGFEQLTVIEPAGSAPIQVAALR